MGQPKTRSIRVSDDVWKELNRLRLPQFGLGEQKSWDKLFNLFLIEHHGNGDWRNKVKYVDLDENLQEELYGIYEKYLKEEIDENEYYKQLIEAERRQYTKVRNKVC